MYQHRDWQGALLELPVSKVVCVGNNYREHIREMGSQVAPQPVLFLKPESALCDLRQPIVIPHGLGEVHHEVELAVLIGMPLSQANEDRVARAVAGYGVALDLTLRDVQRECKKHGYPWEKAKAFDGACPLSGFIPESEFGDAQNAGLTLSVNGVLRQSGNTRDMLTPILPLISYMSRFFTLRAGDVVLTGTPAGVGPLFSGDMLTIGLNARTLTTRII
ncbi:MULTISPECIES: fumarylacetoacetate hydrolase family protein [Edwardsiella]|uniref:Fumarylacetoacetate hydrolase family protein n=2 Tax=Edwardsiella anguillarum TaxID=1821960 RepID=A0A076LT79_9GAMM|nr:MULTISPECIES: fumarylacetoacetate hydrolase family protein [Edwardsiella]AIJ09887.1 fumarylacetoacetate hydrolase family protein [Edwardsiella anguillarum ET080813]AKR77562.1 fumarylacetoacetate hydrolase family protein [Edwardsiella sp. LADL05-105]KAB0589308.1 fumarylacetoacetate hydrolase family protein [Edwardsiella anguillarum]UOU80624.1 fumarylacetoacetate hydrolase family protein [Edwardsiella anguillarum]WHP81678.1 fumarylacetoacetate hydrolase family protein [Edwardsiella anguillaru